MRLRHPFAVEYETAAPELEGSLALFTLPSAMPVGEAVRVAVELGDSPAQSQEFHGENRRTRLAESATFTPPEGDITRRDMLRQRKHRSRGTLDVQTRRLQRKALAK
jgi:hypothetical protein